MNAEKINGVGEMFRFITPVLIGVLCSLILAQVGGIKEQIVKLDNHFINHLSHHNLLEKEYEFRITQLEVVNKIRR